MAMHLKVAALAALLAAAMPEAARGQAAPVSPPHQPGNANQGTLAVDAPNHDFVEMEQTEIGRHVFTLHNKGTDSVTLLPGQASCSCLVSRISVEGKEHPPQTKTEIPPGQSAQVTVEWRPVNIFGKLDKTVTFASTDPRQPPLVLTIRGNVVGKWRLVPPSIGFHDMGVNETREAETNLLIYRGEKWQVNGHTWGSKKGKEFIGLIYEEIPADELAKMSPPPKYGYKLTFTARKGIPVGPLVETVTLDTSPKPSTPVTLCIYGHVTPCVMLMMHPQLRLDNNLLYLGDDVPHGTAKHVDLKIRVAGEHRNATKFSIKKVVPEDLKVTFGEPKANYGGLSFLVPMKVELPATAKPQSWLSANPEEMGQIVIATTNPEARELKILVRFAVVEPKTSAPAP